MCQGFMALQEHADLIILLVEMIYMGQKDLPCFKEGEATIHSMKQRFFPTDKVFNEAECRTYINGLINESLDNWRTVVYDRIQYCCQGILE